MSAVVINGIQVYNGGTYSNFAHNDYTLASGSLWIDHNSDGTKTFSIYPFTGWLYSNYNYSSNGGSFALTNISRQATITSAPDFKDTDNPTITYSNPAGDAVSSLEACISFTGAAADIGYRAISKTGSSYQFNLTEAERDVLRNGTTGPERNVQFFVTTRIGGTDYYSILHRKLTIAESKATKPTVTMTAALNNSALPSVFSSVYIQGKSRLNVTLSATGKYGASIQSYSAVVDGKTYNSGNFTSDVVQGSGSVKIVGYAKDSREITGSAEQTINVMEYSKPRVIPFGSDTAIQCYRSDGNGKRVGDSTSVWVKAKRSYYDLGGKNTCALQYRVKLANDAWNDSVHKWADLIPGSGTVDGYDALIPSKVFDLTKSYTVQLRAIDDIGEFDIKTFGIPTRDVALHLGEGGKNVTIGGYCDYAKPNTFTCNWGAYFNSGMNNVDIRELRFDTNNTVNVPAIGRGIGLVAVMGNYSGWCLYVVGNYQDKNLNAVDLAERIAGDLELTFAMVDGTLEIGYPHATAPWAYGWYIRNLTL